MTERTTLELAMLAAWLNVTPEQLPGTFRAPSDAYTMEAWKRVGDAALEIHHASTADLQARLDAAEGRIAELVGGVGKHIEMLMHGYAPFVEGALSEAMCCSGQMCGCRGASVGEYLAHLLLQDTSLTLATARNTEGNEA